ncbi:IS256 family transposase [Limnochorda pilosa]|uniref:Mutator family transposase n=1 Tax=Limnochorda pilosa TaxID=1555112 RepID=A0A0K2SQ19_LIMPI|nr:IS256 family transposase [Limnochorda pilosa]BAS29186.1 transposase [Limnochorda pilosa]
MKRIPPSRQLGQQIQELLEHGLPEGDGGSLLGEIARLGMRRLIQEALEEEVGRFLGREHYQRRAAGEPLRGHRNGYRTKGFATAEGEIPVAVPQVRETQEPFVSQLLGMLAGRTDELERLTAEMYARGLSTRDIEEAFTGEDGGRLLTRTEVSRITEALWEEYETFRSRSLAELDVVYLFLDAVFEPLRRTGTTREGILCAWGITVEGRRVLLHLALGNKESYENWLEFLRDMVGRGLGTPLTVTTDGAPGLIQAVEAMWPKSLRVRCWAHKARNVLDKVPEEMRAEVKAYLAAVREAPTPADGKEAARRFVERFERDYPSAVRSFTDDLEASLNHLKVPLAHRKYVRTTNLIERSFEEERRRTKVLPRFWTEHSALKLVFATLQRATKRWQRVRITELERKQIAALRRELGLDPDPGPGRKSEESVEKTTHAA